ncbi:ribosome hibernation factor-recruiting GTPase MRF [Mycolicibacterium neworleansense]|uniref:Cobalamin synthesis protein CobW n=1 Tax=Mycolicibacterium neworleansense TaxID=146018 RepID=A0A0H5RZ47_9MYCO|nr:GTP-binding protein [Mycolicibacterium neworleansense]MCV7364170.1 GTP-binding protein [Mycolicibacterium neworleansense]CRZ19136.1 cobalamin synthesis protein CobW [Mycolicibacterium neworleansense]
MRTPVVLIAGQGDSDGVAEELGRRPGTVLVRHAFDGQVVVRTVSDGAGTSELGLELAHGCVSCTVRDDLLILLRRLHRRSDVERIVVQLMPWLEAEPVCWAINTIRVHVGPGYIDGPAARDVTIEAVIASLDATVWLQQSVGDEELPDGRTVAQVVVGQAEFADMLVLNEPDATTLAVLRRLAPRARITVGPDRVELGLAHLEPNSPRGRTSTAHDPLLAGEPPLEPDDEVIIVEFAARRPFHPLRLHEAVDLLLDGVVRTRGRAWLANRPADVMWIESAGGGMHFSNAGKWLAAMDATERAYTDPERVAIAAIDWHHQFGDRHISLTVLVCGARPGDVIEALRGALLTDDELARPDEWADYPDPFGDWHEEPCQPGIDEPAASVHQEVHQEGESQ